MDLDDKTGKDPYGRWVAVCYLGDKGKPGKNFNKMLVDANHAVIEGFKNNEFDPGSWWGKLMKPFIYSLLPLEEEIKAKHWWMTWKW